MNKITKKKKVSKYIKIKQNKDGNKNKRKENKGEFENLKAGISLVMLFINYPYK